MATRRCSIIPGWLWPGLLNATLLASVALLTFGALWSNAPKVNWLNFLLQDSYLCHVIVFSLWQALLSTFFSVIPAILLANALWKRRFPGRQLLLRLYAMTLVLPVLVAIFGLLSVYGREGWLAQICTLLGIEYHFSPYGLKGILLAHVFFNLPLATHLLLQGLENIPREQCQLSAQLGIEGWYFFRLVMWPWFRHQILSATSLIFTLCFASFGTVLALGGGPQATTIELAIFQALSYDYDLGKAALLALLQIVFCLSLMMLNQNLSKTLSCRKMTLSNWYAFNYRLSSLIQDTLIIVITMLLILPPLLAVVVDGIRYSVYGFSNQSALWKATLTSLRIALIAGLLSVLMAMLLLWSSRELRLQQHFLAGKILETSGMLIFTMPSIVLATGFFLLFNGTVGIPQQTDSIVILTNALMAIPYAMKILENPMYDIAECYQRLCLLLHIRGWQRVYLIELRALQRPLAQALAFSCVISIGDFGIVALFGSTDFCTLPFYLYQQIGTYRNTDGAFTAFLLLLLCFFLFTLIENIPRYRANLN